MVSATAVCLEKGLCENGHAVTLYLKYCYQVLYTRVHALRMFICEVCILYTRATLARTPDLMIWASRFRHRRFLHFHSVERSKVYLNESGENGRLKCTAVEAVAQVRRFAENWFARSVRSESLKDMAVERCVATLARLIATIR